jgi:RTX calcium-binding nonapeptide repeat (4 copies)
LGKIYLSISRADPILDEIAIEAKDVIDGKGGDDLICGAAGNDSIRGGTGNDSCTADAGDTVMNCSP